MDNTYPKMDTTKLRAAIDAEFARFDAMIDPASKPALRTEFETKYAETAPSTIDDMRFETNFDYTSLEDLAAGRGDADTLLPAEVQIGSAALSKYSGELSRVHRTMNILLETPTDTFRFKKSKTVYDSDYQHNIQDDTIYENYSMTKSIGTCTYAKLCQDQMMRCWYDSPLETLPGFEWLKSFKWHLLKPGTKSYLTPAADSPAIAYDAATDATGAFVTDLGGGVEYHVVDTPGLNVSDIFGESVCIPLALAHPRLGQFYAPYFCESDMRTQLKADTVEQRSLFLEAARLNADAAALVFSISLGSGGASLAMDVMKTSFEEAFPADDAGLRHVYLSKPLGHFLYNSSNSLGMATIETVYNARHGLTGDDRKRGSDICNEVLLAQMGANLIWHFDDPTAGGVNLTTVNGHTYDARINKLYRGSSNASVEWNRVLSSVPGTEGDTRAFYELPIDERKALYNAARNTATIKFDWNFSGSLGSITDWSNILYTLANTGVNRSGVEVLDSKSLGWIFNSNRLKHIDAAGKGLDGITSDEDIYGSEMGWSVGVTQLGPYAPDQMYKGTDPVKIRMSQLNTGASYFNNRAVCWGGADSSRFIIFPDKKVFYINFECDWQSIRLNTLFDVLLDTTTGAVDGPQKRLMRFGNEQMFIVDEIVSRM